VAWQHLAVPRIALLAHGAGSSPATALRLLSTAVASDVRPVPVEARGSVDDVVLRLHAAAAGRDVVLAAGISLGAHAVASWSLDGGRADSLLLAMPAWTGAPDAVAGLTCATSDAIGAHGRDAVLAAIAAQAPDDWVVRELVDSWATYTDPDLAAALRAAGASWAPTRADLARLALPVAVVALAKDPLHPEAVAHEWAAAIPEAALVTVPRDAPAHDIGALGVAGRRALRQLRSE
jgi:pimeloyl-ACP methyl ester carboxylesterase